MTIEKTQIFEKLSALRARIFKKATTETDTETARHLVLVVLAREAFKSLEYLDIGTLQSIFAPAANGCTQDINQADPTPLADIMNTLLFGNYIFTGRQVSCVTYPLDQADEVLQTNSKEFLNGVIQSLAEEGFITGAGTNDAEATPAFRITQSGIDAFMGFASPGVLNNLQAGLPIFDLTLWEDNSLELSRLFRMAAAMGMSGTTAAYICEGALANSLNEEMRGYVISTLYNSATNDQQSRDDHPGLTLNEITDQVARRFPSLYLHVEGRNLSGYVSNIVIGLQNTFTVILDSQGEGELRFKLSLDAMRYQAERMAHLEAVAELRRQP